MHSNSELAVVTLSSKVNFFRFYLVGNVYQEHIKVIVVNMIWLEENFNLVGRLCRNCRCRRYQNKRHSLLLVSASMYFGLQSELDSERTYVFNFKCLFHSLVYNYIAKLKQSILWLDVNFWSNSDTLHEHGNSSEFCEKNDALFVDLLGERFELNYHNLGFTWRNTPHCVKNAEATKR